MKWLVTGAAGFIGTNLCLRLMTDGHEVTGWDYAQRPDCLEGTRYQRLYLHNLNEKELSKHDVIVHLAAQTAVTKSILFPWNKSL
jgi:nucleoside-diphosphate-sugar epimerase